MAITILAAAGSAIVALATEAGNAVARARATERELRRASALLEAIALWPREDLDRHLGERREGSSRLRVDRPAQTLYTIVLLDSTGRRELLRTALYRPEPRHATAQGGPDAQR